MLPRDNAPNGKRQLNDIECGSAVKSEPKVVAQPRNIPDRPEPEAKTVLFNVENRSGQAQCRNAPGKCRNHENNPFLHISAKRGSRKRNSLMTSVGVTFSR